jgi:hypothetical protein
MGKNGSLDWYLRSSALSSSAPAICEICGLSPTSILRLKPGPAEAIFNHLFH